MGRIPQSKPGGTRNGLITDAQGKVAADLNIIVLKVTSYQRRNSATLQSTKFLFKNEEQHRFGIGLS